ncbi:MAG: hypothetical protein MUO62_00975, partial [Anaerolineales bacterium]|nr:hypothetical protein [Anaerolineales bacterium]
GCPAAHQAAAAEHTGFIFHGGLLRGLESCLMGSGQPAQLSGLGKHIIVDNTEDGFSSPQQDPFPGVAFFSLLYL